MNKIFLFVGGLLCILLAESAEPETSSEEIIEGEENEPFPDLNCILFENAGCNAYCTSLSVLYGKATLGKCSKHQTCECTTPRKGTPTLRSLWNDTFLPNTISRKILKTIENDRELAADVRDTIEQFPRTRTDILDEMNKVVLQDVDGIEQLKINPGRVPVQDYINENGNVDLEKLGREFIPMLRKSLGVVHFPVKNMDYVKNLQKFLEKVSDDEEMKRYIEDSVNKTNNFDLKKLINPESNNNPYVFGNTNDEPSYVIIPEYVAAMITNQLIKQTKINKTVRKSPTRPSRRSTTRTKTPARKVQPAQSSKAASSPPKAPVKEVQADDDSIDLHTYNEYFVNTDDGFTSIDRITPPYIRSWNLKDGKVDLDINEQGAITLHWKKGYMSVDLKKSAKGRIEQQWDFGITKIKIIREADGAVDQFWEMRGKPYEYHRDAAGNVDASRDIPAVDRLEFNDDLVTWCQANKKFFPYDACTVFKV